MKSFNKWLEEVATARRGLSLDVGNGGFDDVDDDDDGNNDDDYEDGPWGWKKMKSLNLALHQWAKTSPSMQQISKVITSALFQVPDKEEIRVFPNHVQVEIDYFLDISTWGDLDDKIENILKRSDLYKPLGIQQAQLWDVVDKGAVYDYMMYVIIINLTGRGIDRGRSPLDNQAAFAAWNYVREDWATLEKTIKWFIEAEWESNYPHLQGQNLNIRLKKGRAFDKPMGVSQAENHAERLWAKGIVQVSYELDVPDMSDEEEETAWRWGHGGSVKA